METRLESVLEPASTKKYTRTATVWRVETIGFRGFPPGAMALRAKIDEKFEEGSTDLAARNINFQVNLG